MDMQMIVKELSAREHEERESIHHIGLWTHSSAPFILFLNTEIFWERNVIGQIAPA